MNLAPDTKLGPYEILTLLGKGGMGEVYRATDTRLRREVAVKVSAERFTRLWGRGLVFGSVDAAGCRIEGGQDGKNENPG